MNIKHVAAASALLIVGACADTPDSSKSTVAFTATEIPQTSGNGIMIMGVRAFDMDSHDHIGNDQQVLTGIAVKNQDTGQNFNIYLTGDFAVSQLPAGTYCVASFRTYSNIDLSYCKPPYFTVPQNDAVNAGYVLIGIDYRGHGGGVRYKPFYFYKSKLQLTENLTTAAANRVRNFLGDPQPSLQTLAGSKWYGYDYLGMYYEWRFKDGGVVESQADALGSYGPLIQGKWKLDGTKLTVEFPDLSLLCEGTLKGGALSGIATISTDHTKSDRIYTDARWLWQMTSNPATPAPFGNSVQAKPVYRGGTSYPTDAFTAGTTGSVTVHYKLSKPKDTGMGFGVPPSVLPSEVKVISSNPTGVFDSNATWAVKSSYYANLLAGGRPVESDGDETITFKIVDGKPMIGYTHPLQPLSGSEPNP